MTETSWSRVGRALLGRWPSQVATWGEEGIAAFVEELEADGLTPDQALAGLRMHRPPDGKDYPPSVAVVTALALSDPSKPTFDETLTLIRRALRALNLPLTGSYGSEAEMAKIRKQRVLDRAGCMHPLVASFVDRHGVYRLVDEVGELDGRYGAIRRQELETAWAEHCDAFEGREVAALVSGRRGEMARLDPLAALNTGIAPRQLGSGSGA